MGTREGDEDDMCVGEAGEEREGEGEGKREGEAERRDPFRQTTKQNNYPSANLSMTTTIATTMTRMAKTMMTVSCLLSTPTGQAQLTTLSLFLCGLHGLCHPALRIFQCFSVLFFFGGSLFVYTECHLEFLNPS